MSFYKSDRIEIFNKDCLEILPKFKNSIDVIFTSPPYNKGNTSGNEWKRLDEKGYGTHSDRMPHKEYVEWQQEVIQAGWDSLTEDGVFFYQDKPMAKGNETRLPLELKPLNVPMRQIIIWDRGSGFQRDGMHYVPRYEWVMVFAKPKFRLSSRSVDDLWKITPKSNKDHPATFPKELPLTALKSTKLSEDTVVLDPFMGIGTTLLACLELNLWGIGIELEESYCDKAVENIENNSQ